MDVKLFFKRWVPKLRLRIKGSPSSGNWNHAGRPGLREGSSAHGNAIPRDPIGINNGLDRLKQNSD